MRIRRRLVRLFPLVAMSATLGIATASNALAHVEPPCHASAMDVNGKANPASITIDNTDEWHVSKDSNLHGEGHAGGPQISGTASAAALGFRVIDIASGSGKGTSGEGSLDISQYAKYAKVFVGIGSSVPDQGQVACSGSLTVVVDDEAALDTYVGKGAVGTAVLGAIGVLGVALRRRGGKGAVV